jgi:hypothetical protein
VPERVADDALDLLLRPEPEQKGTIGGRRRDVRERQHPDPGLGGDRTDRGHRLVEERSEQDHRTFLDRLLGRLPAALRSAGAIPRQKHEVVGADIEQRELRRVLHVLGKLRGRSGERQEQPDPDLAGRLRLDLGLRRRYGLVRLCPVIARAACEQEQQTET